MVLESVYTASRQLLGEEYINISILHRDTRKAIIQLIHLNELVNIYERATNNVKQAEPINKES